MKKIIIPFLVFFFWTSLSVQAQDISSFFKATDGFLKTYVSNGKVDYKAIHANPQSLNDLMKQAKDILLTNEDKATMQAFWINAYNISVIKGVIDHYPIASPLDKKGFFDGITYKLAGKSITLNDIENKQLRAVYNDARFHFVLVCGALGCPPLITDAYMPDTLDTQLETQTKIALNNPDFIKVSGKKVAFSQIFEWYKKDFIQDGNEIDFLNTFRKEKVPANAKVTYYSYDWRLNSK